MRLLDIIEAIDGPLFRVTDHADEETHADGLTLDEICFSVRHGEIIEEYPADRPYPSCLVYGRAIGENPVHSVWAYNAAARWAVLVTVYRPDPDRWIEWRQRRR
ncbi:MAG: DUF4258 domain-containing protein [Deltaproteobacteria bacterium]|nr:DUF4258 domain-containing protein [Deltaproteobacteria bacterium]